MSSWKFNDEWHEAEPNEYRIQEEKMTLRESGIETNIMT
jgi:hypothetical protein